MSDVPAKGALRYTSESLAPFVKSAMDHIRGHGIALHADEWRAMQMFVGFTISEAEYAGYLRGHADATKPAHGGSDGEGGG